MLTIAALVSREGAPLWQRMHFECSALRDEWHLAGSLGDSPPVSPCDGLGQPLRAELSFFLSMDPREELDTDFSGLAFNLRHERLAVNVVGDAVVDCERALNPDDCYAAANLTYDLSHQGDVQIEGFDGVNHAFTMEPGRIRTGRALVANRVLTSPLDSTTDALISPYERSEFRGRPLRGAYSLRLAGGPEVAWERLDSIQILTRYRFWSRQESVR